MGTQGGFRKNAGRPKGSKASHTLESEAVRKSIIKRVKKDTRPVLDALIHSALGLWYEEKMPNGGKRIYKQKPDVQAAKYLFDQVVGRPKEMQEVTGKDGGAIEYNFGKMEIKDLDKELKKILKK